MRGNAEKINRKLAENECRQLVAPSFKLLSYIEATTFVTTKSLNKHFLLISLSLTFLETILQIFNCPRAWQWPFCLFRQGHKIFNKPGAANEIFYSYTLITLI